MIPVSVILPVYNEHLNLTPLYHNLVQVLEPLGEEFELIFVDDGSDDGSFAVIEALHRQDSRVLGIRLRRNFGKSAAYVTGFRHARGNIIVTMDSDQQDDPRDLPAFLACLAQGVDVVIGWKTSGKNTPLRSFASRLFNKTVSHLTGVRLHDTNCPFRAMRRAIFEEIEIYGDLFRFIPILAAARGFVVREIPIRNLPRPHGKTHFGFARYYRGFLDLLTVLMLTRFLHRPLHFIGMSGLLASLAGAGTLGFLLCAHLLHVFGVLQNMSWDLHERPLLTLGILLIMVGVQFLSLGLLGELVINRCHRGTEERWPVREVLAVRTPKTPHACSPNASGADCAS
ncbi:MAG: glycosyltransferase family 2 protein [Magnetococcus sp. WYHC-3]